MNRAAIAAVAATLALAGCGTASTQATPTPTSSPTPTSRMAVGTLTASVQAFATNAKVGDQCTVVGDNVDLYKTQVIIKDATGKTVGFSSLNLGTVSRVFRDHQTSCDFQFAISGVPAGAGPYEVFLSNRRGSATVAEGELASIHLSLE